MSDTHEPRDYVANVEQMIQTTIHDRSEWWYRVEDLDDANELLRVAVQTAANAIDVEEKSPAGHADAQLRAVALTEGCLMPTPSPDLAHLMPTTLTEAHTVVLALAHVAARYVVQATGGESEAAQGELARLRGAIVAGIAAGADDE